MSFIALRSLPPTVLVHIDCVVFVTAVYELLLLISVYKNDYKSDQFKGRQESVCVCVCVSHNVNMIMYIDW